jgi:predicted nucleic acid-binding protein
MVSGELRIKYFDASALVKLYINEKGSQELRDFFKPVANCYTTWLCLAEALAALKSKWSGSQSKNFDTRIEIDQYIEAVVSLIINWRNRIESDDINSIDPTVPLRVKEIAEKYKLDYSDALQLWTVKNGKHSRFLVESEPNVYESALVLITADKEIASAADSEGIKVWNCTTGPAPDWAY